MNWVEHRSSTETAFGVVRVTNVFSEALIKWISDLELHVGLSMLLSGLDTKKQIIIHVQGGTGPWPSTNLLVYTLIPTFRTLNSTLPSLPFLFSDRLFHRRLKLGRALCVNLLQCLRSADIPSKEFYRCPGQKCRTKGRGPKSRKPVSYGSRKAKKRYTNSRISGRTTVNPPISARIDMAKSPFVIPPSTFRCCKSVPESSFMLSIIARVWKAFASRVARAMCEGLVYWDTPREDIESCHFWYFASSHRLSDLQHQNPNKGLVSRRTRLQSRLLQYPSPSQLVCLRLLHPQWMTLCHAATWLRFRQQKLDANPDCQLDTE